MLVVDFNGSERLLMRANTGGIITALVGIELQKAEATSLLGHKQKIHCRVSQKEKRISTIKNKTKKETHVKLLKNLIFWGVGFLVI